MRHVIFPELPEGREYMCIGPHVWQTHKDANLAIEECKKRFGSGRTWRFKLIDVPAGAWLDEMGDFIRWKIPENGPEPAPTREILLYDPTPKEKK